MGTRSHRSRAARTAITAILRSFATAALLTLLTPALAPAAGVPTDPAEVRSYWTQERMRDAVPLELEPVPVAPASLSRTARARADRGAGYTRSEVGDPSAEGVRMHGKVFLTIEGGGAPGDYVCSGTALDSDNESVVWSAGHCVFDTEGGGYASNWLFVPAYKSGAAPFGEWPAAELSSPSEWRQSANSSYDYSAARVARNGAGKTLTDVVGGRGIGFNQPRSQEYSSYGYPAEQPPLEFTGGREFRCDSGLGGTDNPPGSGPSTSWIGCDMTGGSSGGGWVAGGKVLGVNSYSYCLALVCEERLYSPYLDDTAKRLFNEIAGAASYCGEEKVTILGTGGADRLEGTGGKDVILAKGGKDVVEGRDGKDTICGGDGADRLEGGGGKDDLRGADGADKLEGGGGKDSCNGGDGEDSAKSCESRKKIP